MSKRSVVVLAVSAIALLLVAGAAWGVPLAARKLGLSDPSWRTDARALHISRQRLGQVQQRLRSLPSVPGATSHSSRIMGCRTDSGDLFQPNLTALWYVPRSQVNEAATTLVANLRASGWRGPA